MLGRIFRKYRTLFYIISLALFLGLFVDNFINFYPDIFLLLIIFLSIYFSQKISFFAAIVLGALKDILATTPLGFYILGFLLSRFIIEKLKKRIYPGRIIIDTFLVFISSCACYLYIFLMSNFKNFSYPFNQISFILTFIVIIYTTLISIPLFLIFKRIKDYQMQR